jgi:hypothetical protein
VSPVAERPTILRWPTSALRRPARGARPRPAPRLGVFGPETASAPSTSSTPTALAAALVRSGDPSLDLPSTSQPAAVRPQALPARGLRPQPQRDGRSPRRLPPPGLDAVGRPRARAVPGARLLGRPHHQPDERRQRPRHRTLGRARDRRPGVLLRRRRLGGGDGPALPTTARASARAPLASSGESRRAATSPRSC